MGRGCSTIAVCVPCNLEVSGSNPTKCGAICFSPPPKRESGGEVGVVICVFIFVLELTDA